jgi:putative DNA primase/helicase
MPSAPVERVLSKLPTAKSVAGGGWVAKCPGHRDRAPSLKIDEGSDGRALLRCHAGCTTEQIVSGMLLTMRDLMPDTPTDAPAFSPARAGHLRVVGNTALKAETAEPHEDRRSWPETARYDYTDADGVLLFSVIRKQAPDGQGKSFTQMQPDGTYGLKGIPERPLFRLPAVLRAVRERAVVLLVEGEKDVLTAESLGWVATTNCGGANAWREEYTTWLGDADVVLIPDNDKAGRQWAETVARNIQPAVKRLRIIALPRVPEKGDLTDWVATGGTSDALGGMILQAKAWNIGDPIPEPPAASKFTVYRADELTQLPATSWLVEDVLPADALAALVGPSGKGKTFLTLDLSCSIATGRPWLGHTGGPVVPVLYIAAEGTAGLRARIAAWIAEYGTLHHAMPLYFICETVNLLTEEDVDHVVRAMVALPAPPKLVVVDTLHRAMPGGDENSAKDVGLVITHADRIRRFAGCTVLIVHHSKKDADIERGSTALRAACDTLLMLRDEEGTRTLTCEKQKDAADFAPHALSFTPAHGSVLVGLSTGTDSSIERTTDPEQLSTNERLALAALADAGLSTGLTATEWKQASGVADRSFYRVRAGLVRAGLVSDASQRGQKYSVTSTGIAALRLTATVTANFGHNSVAVSGSNFLTGTVGGTPLKGGFPLNYGESNRRETWQHGSGSNGGRSRGLRRLPSPPAHVLESRDFDPDEAYR